MTNTKFIFYLHYAYQTTLTSVIISSQVCKINLFWYLYSCWCIENPLEIILEYSCGIFRKLLCLIYWFQNSIKTIISNTKFYSTLNTYESYKLLGNHHTILMELKLFFFIVFFVSKRRVESCDDIAWFNLNFFSSSQTSNI